MPDSPFTLCLLVDALRVDYVARAPYLCRLAARSATGALRECFGFVPRAAYFGGLDAEAYGFTNMFCFDPEHSPFGMAAALPASPAGAVAEAAVGVRQRLEASARERMAPFAQLYGSSAEIPLRFLPFFDLVEKRAPWDRRVGYESLFAQLDEHGIPWHQCSWPETNRLADRSDQGIVRQTLADLRPEHRFAYVHLGELDGIGHAFGPGSAQLQKHLADTDRLCEELIETLRARYAAVNVVIFGDHGMVNVTRTLDVQTVLESTGLTPGADFAYFLDSTMARLWFHHAGARATAEAALQKLDGGRVLGADDLRRYGIAGCDRRNAELIFLADPGVLIFPNFFQGHGEPIKGMHGYDPDCPDNLGFFLLHSPADPALPGARLGKVNPPELFPLLRQLIGLPGAGASPVAPKPAPTDPEGRFTCHPDPAADETVARHLARITEAVLVRFGAPEAVVLTGSFGRGEGGVFRGAEGRYLPVNDYDLVLVGGRDPGLALKQLGDELAKELGLDYVDLGWSDGHWEKLPISVQHFDLKYGSQVIAGDATVLDRLPAYASADIPAYEAVKLLLNRTAGLLTGLRGEFIDGTAPSAGQRRYLTNQFAKALMAMGDWHLIRWEGYDASYRRRAQRFESLARGAGLPSALVRQIVAAYEFKCLPDYGRFAGGLKEIQSLHPELELALIHSINLHAEGHAQDISAAMALHLESMSADPGWVSADNALVAAHPEVAPRLQPGRPAGVSLRHLVYAALPFLLVAAGDARRASRAFDEAHARLAPFFQLPVGGAFSPKSWEQLRAQVIHLWFALCH